MLIPDANATDRGVHDVTLLDMADAVGPVLPVGDLWPYDISGFFRWCPVCPGNRRTLSCCIMSVNSAFAGHGLGVAHIVARTSKNDMARHVSSFHLNSAKLCRWRDAPSGRALHRTVSII